MKSYGSGVLLIGFLAIAGVAIGIWSWSSVAGGEPTTPSGVAAADAANNAANNADERANARVSQVGADVETGAGGASAVRTEVPIDDGIGDNAGPRDPEEPAGVHRVRGRVVDLRGAGVGGARVTIADRDLEKLPLGIVGLGDLMDKSGDGVSTDDNGEFDLMLKASGKYRLIATHDEHPRAEHQGVASGDIEGIVMQLRDGAQITGRIVGAPADVKSIFVYSKRVESAIENATSGVLFDIGDLIDVVGTPLGRSAETGEDRTFALRGLDPEERYIVWAANADVTDRLPVKSTHAMELRAGTIGAELIWREPLTVSVRVVDAATNAPIERLDVAAGFVKEIKMLGMSMPIPTTRPLRQKDFPAGVVRIDGLEVLDEGEPVLAVEIRAEGKRPWVRHDVKVPRSGHVDLGVAVLEQSAVVIARVVDKDGHPVVGAEVKLIEVQDQPEQDGGEEARGGSISFSTNVSTPGGDPGGKTGAERDFDVIMGGRAASMTAVTDDEGVCRITAEFEGRGQLRVQKDDYAPSGSDEFVVAPRGEVEIDITMHRGGTVQVTTIDGHGAPAPRTFIQRKGPVEGDEGKARSDDNGVVSFEALSVGEHTFKLLDVDASDSGPFKVGLTGILDTSSGEPVQVVDGKTTFLTLQQPLRGSVTGIVTLDGVFLDGASVRLFGAKAAEEEIASEMLGSMLSGFVKLGSSSETDVDGFYEMERIAVGDYRLVVKHKDLVMPSAIAIKILEGSNRFDVAIRATTVRGRVVDASGKPVARATLSVMPAESELADLADQMGDAREMMAEIFGGGEAGSGIRTASDGTFELRGVRSGTPLVVGAKARLHVAGSSRIEAIAEGGDRSGVEVVLKQAGRVRVSAIGVRGALSTKLQWAGAPSDDPSGSAPRDREGLLRRGRTTIDGLQPGQWSVEIVGMGLPASLQPRIVEVGAGRTERVDFGK